ncbi:6-hydroxypseudooxynicotine dehydrogenase complex subunit alpha [Moorella humiferrea]|uniref:FAD binding domain-containing protein n=1 Tax=Neomoorella humiferrea TaxID=676965 RepID=UPI0030D5B570
MSVQYYSPGSFTEALQVLERNSNYTLLAGGTDVVPRLNLRQVKGLQGLIYLGNIVEMKKIVEHNEHIFIGALVTHACIAASELIKQKAYNVWYASYHMGTPAIRNVGTIGGNLVNASPAGDSCVALLAAGALASIKSLHENRLVPINEFFVDKGKTVLKPGEILYGVYLPKAATGIKKGCSYQRIGTLKGSSTAIINIAVEIEQDTDGMCRACRIGAGAVASTPVRLYSLEEIFVDKRINWNLIEQAVNEVDAYINPIDDTYATAWYRRKVIKVLLKRALAEASGLASEQKEV